MPSQKNHPKHFDLMKTWVKTLDLRKKHLVLVSNCSFEQYQETLKEILKANNIKEEDITQLIICPEVDSIPYGKIGSMLRVLSEDRHKLESIVVIWNAGSPHCVLLPHAVNEALFLTKQDIPRLYFSVRRDGTFVKVEPEILRLARYPIVLQQVLEVSPEFKERLMSLLGEQSLEHRQKLIKAEEYAAH